VGLPLGVALSSRGLSVTLYDINADAVATVNAGILPFAEEGVAEPLRDGQLLVLRSTVHPGVTALTERLVARLGMAVDVAFCPERIAEGRAMTELFELPQIVAARIPAVMARAEKLFRHLTMEHPAAHNEDFNLSTEESTTVRELAEVIWRKLKGQDVPLRLVHDTPFEHDVQKRVPDVTKAREVLGFEATTSLDKMLDEVIPWIERAAADGRL
jgi:UDP-glucose 6-dehydrogenase